jgi:glutamate-ammonia-ligase adenylyltransferase
MVDVEEVWQPFAARFAALALGELDDDTPGRSLHRCSALSALSRIDQGFGPALAYGLASPMATTRAAATCSARTSSAVAADVRQVDQAADSCRRAFAMPIDLGCAATASSRPSGATRAAEGARGGSPCWPPCAPTGLRRRLLAVLGASSASVTTWSPTRTSGRPWPPPPTAWHRPSRVGSTGRSGTADRRAAQRVPAGAALGIAAADLTGGRGLEQTMAALSALADATLAAAYDIAVAELPAGTPEPRLAVVALGKCGGGELNYAPRRGRDLRAAGDEDLAAATTVATRLIHICGLVAWPVDAALRPEGNRGPLVRSLASHLAYYRRWARTWEFQALLKARPAAGDLELAAEWIEALAPLVWTAAERPQAVEDVRSMRRKIIENIPPKELDREIKRGSGGLRDIEFAVQLLQLVHGRGDETLRAPGTIPALRALVGGGYVGRADGEALLRGYRFLRTVEHRLQPRACAVPHRADRAGRAALAGRRVGYTATPGRDAVEGFRVDWVTHATEVRRLHAKLLYRPLLESVARVPADGLRLTPEAARHRLEILGFADPAGALRHLQALTGGVSRTAAIQRTLLPVLLSEFADAPEPDRGLLNYRQVSDKLGSTPGTCGCCATRPVARRLAWCRRFPYAADLLARELEALRLGRGERATRAPATCSARGLRRRRPAHRPGRGHPRGTGAAPRELVRWPARTCWPGRRAAPPGPGARSGADGSRPERPARRHRRGRRRAGRRHVPRSPPRLSPGRAAGLTSLR